MSLLVGMRWRHSLARLAAVGAVVVVVSASLDAGESAARAATPAGVVYYLAIGASQTLGFQGSGPGGVTLPTEQGYTNDLIAMERGRWPDLGLALFACPGLRVAMALSGGGTTRVPQSLQHAAGAVTTGRCRSQTGSEVAEASAFIRTHPGQVVLVTLDLGYADIAACLAGESVNSTCVAEALARIRAGLPAVVSRLRAVGGGALRIVGLDHEDPFLAYYLVGANPDPAFADASVAVTERFNRVVNAAYASVGVRVAQVGVAFATGDVTLAYFGESGEVPLEVKAICALTWMCTRGNIHPNPRGYRRIASAVAADVERRSPVSAARQSTKP